jgi:cytochrome c1
LRDPAAQKPTAHMPRLALQEDEIRALAAYLATLR